MSIEQNKAAARRFVDEVVNRGSMEAFDELVAPSWREATEDGFDRERLREIVVAWRSGMPDVRASIDLIAAEGDLVAVRCTVVGTHTQEYLGIPPTGKEVRGTLAYFDRYVDGRCVESWTESGSKGFYEQLTGTPYQQPVVAG